VEANIGSAGTRYACVRYGNVIASRGSVVPLFREQIAQGGPVTVTLREMTRFLLSLDHAVDTVLAAAHEAKPGETYVPRAPAARVVDVAAAMIGERRVPVTFTGIRPGEKIHEIMISEEERYRTVERGSYYVILPMLPELRAELSTPPLATEYSSEDITLDQDGLRKLLEPHLTESAVGASA
jgi:FlaA1/EpsC-like NDP-sugar epimerase